MGSRSLGAKKIANLVGHLAKYGVSKAAPAVVMMLMVPVWIRLYGAGEYAFQSLAWVTASTASALSAGWLRQSLLRFAGRPASTMRDLPHWVSVMCGGSALLLTLGMSYLLLGRYEQRWALVAAASVYALLLTYYLLAQAEAQRDARSGRYAVSETLRFGVTALVTVALSMTSLLSLPGAVQIIIGFCIGTLAARFVIGPASGASSSTGLPAPLAEFWRFGWPLTVWLGASMLLTYVDRYIVILFLGEGVGGEYAAVSDIVVRGFTVVTFPLTMVAHPSIMRAYNAGSLSRAISLGRQYSVVLIAICLLSVLGALALGGVALDILVPDARLNMLVVPILAGGTVLWQLALMLHKPLELLQKSRLMVILLSLSLALTVVCGVILTPLLGEVGAALGYGLGAALYCILSGSVSGHLLRRMND